MRLWALALFAAAIVACTDDDGRLDGPRAPRFVAPAAAPSVALALGSGGPRGFAHIGALLALEESGIRADLVVGSSAGALVGALHAAGLTALQLEALAMDMNVLDFIEARMVAGRPATGRALQDYVNRQVGGRRIEEFPRGFAAVAARQGTSEAVIFNAGDAGAAVRASSASPGQFAPVRIGEGTFVDGDEASPVPILAARSLGARVVIAVDVSAHAATTPARAPVEWIRKDERRAARVRAEAPQADVIVHPDIGYYAGHDADYRRRVIEIARRETLRRMPEIRAALARAGIAQASGTASSPPGVAAR